jgi:hypothetical protein
MINNLESEAFSISVGAVGEPTRGTLAAGISQYASAVSNPPTVTTTPPVRLTFRTTGSVLDLVKQPYRRLPA